MSTLSRAAYTALYGPTIGDKIRLGDTELFIEVQEDLTQHGEEATPGTVRDGMGQSQRQADEVMDLVLTNVVMLDFWGVIKADIGIRNGRIAAIGKAGNPDIQPGVDIPIGPGTDLISGAGLIVTAGGIDALAHFISPRIAEEALCAGITTLIGGGCGPTTGSMGAASTPGARHLRRMLQATESLPVNIGLLGKGSGSQPNALEEQVRAGAMGLLLHPYWGVAPTAIGCALDIAEKMDVQVALFPDPLNEAGFLADSFAALRGRSVHAYLTTGVGSGHALEEIVWAEQAEILPATFNTCRPYSHNARAVQRDLPVTARHLLPALGGTDDSARAELRAAALVAEDFLHDMGALSVLASGAQALGRVGETILRTWQTAHAMKLRRGHLLPPPPPFGAEIDRGDNDNYRVKRYLSKYTINPAIVYGIAHEVGSLEVGKLADLVLWKPAFFGVKPSLVLKGGMIAAAPLGEANAALPGTQPTLYRLGFGLLGGAASANCMTFISQWALQAGEPQRLELKRRIGVARDVRQVRKVDLIHNCARPRIEIDLHTHQVRADGELLIADPPAILPLSQRYFLF